MSVTLDPTKKPYVPPTSTTSPAATASTASTAKGGKLTLQLDAAPEGPQPKLAHLFSPAPANGPGVLSSVFGAKTPEPRKMTAEELATGVEKSVAAIRKNPGLVSDADLALHGALVAELAARQALLLDDKTPASKLGNRELFHQLLTFDLAQQGGATLTPAQVKRQAELEGARKARGQNDVSGEIGKLEKRHREAVAGAELHCKAITGGVAATILHMPAISLMASTALVAHAVQRGDYRGAAIDAGLAFLAHGGSELAEPVEVIEIARNAYECHEKRHEAAWTGKAIADLKAAHPGK